MKRNIKYKDSDNVAKIFGGILTDLERIAENNNLPVQEVIRMFITDLQNISNEDYESKLKDVHIEGPIPAGIKKKLISFLNIAIKKYAQLAKKDAQKEKQINKKEELNNIWEEVKSALANEGEEISKDSINSMISEIEEGTNYPDLTKKQKSYVLKKLKELAEIIDKKDREEELQRVKNANKKWKEIVEIVDSESENTGKSKLELWEEISRALFGEKKDDDFSLEVPQPFIEDIKNMVYDKIKSEGLEYYKDVERYTQNFEFLTGFRGITFATSGHKSFRNPQHAKMFEELVSTLRKNTKVDFPEQEETFLKRVLEEGLIETYYGKEIIKGRLNRIEIEKKAYKRNNNRSSRE